MSDNLEADAELAAAIEKWHQATQGDREDSWFISQFVLVAACESPTAHDSTLYVSHVGPNSNQPYHITWGLLQYALRRSQNEYDTGDDDD